MTLPHAHGDFETRSAIDLKKSGAHVYASHWTTDALCFAWAIGDEPVEVWTPANPGNIRRLFDHIAAGGIFVAHNAAFERAIWAFVMQRRYGWPPLPLKQVRCTMAQALAMALPASLEGLGEAIRLDISKDLVGKALMMQLSKPRRRITDANGVVSYTWWEDPEKLQRLYAYCAQDVEVERKAEKKVLPLSEEEQAVWCLDQEINDRGVQIDMKAVHTALEVIEDAKQRLDTRMALVTKGEVTTCSQVQALKDWLASKGFEVDGLAKADVTDLLKRDDLPEDVRAAVQLRQEAAKSSTAKLKAMAASVNVDGRARGLHQFHGANTGRWAGRRVQPQNFPRTAKAYAPIVNEFLDLLSDASRSSPQVALAPTKIEEVVPFEQRPWRLLGEAFAALARAA